MKRALSLFIAAAIALPARADDASALRDLEARLARERDAAAELAKREVTLLGQLAALERLIDVEGRALRAAQHRLRLVNKRLSLAEARFKEAQDELDERTDALAPRLLARYKLGREGYLRLMLSSRSVGDVLRRRKLLAAVVQHDIEAMAELRVAAEDARSARDELASAKKAVAETAAAESERRKSLQELAAQQKRLIASVQDQRTTHEGAIRELEEAARELSRRVAEIQRTEPEAGSRKPEAQAAVPFKKLRGKLLFPVAGGRIEVRFGRHVDRRFGTTTLQRGIDVRAPEGTPVLAPHQGKVVHSGWFRGYGNLVIVDHGENYYSLMAHLGTLAKALGEQVRAGESVGTLGDTGSLKGPYLYFELRQGTRPVDPERWLSRNRKAAAKMAKKG